MGEVGEQVGDISADAGEGGVDCCLAAHGEHLGFYSKWEPSYKGATWHSSHFKITSRCCGRTNLVGSVALEGKPMVGVQGKGLQRWWPWRIWWTWHMSWRRQPQDLALDWASDVRMTDAEASKITPRFLAWAPRWIIMPDTKNRRADVSRFGGS